MALRQLTHYAARFVLGLVLGLTALLTGCGGGGGGGSAASNNPPQVTLSSITITPSTPLTIDLGATTTLTATGHYSDSSTANITAQVSWSSGSIITVAGTGAFNGAGLGTTTITATMGAISSPPLSITVIAPTSISVTPASIAIGVNTIVNLSAVGINGSTTSTLTSLVSWSSSDSTIASVNSSTGIVSGIAAGTATITATFTNLSPATATVTISTGVGGHNLATSRYDHTANLLTTGPNSGKVLVAGGYVTGPSDTIKTTELYDPVTAT